MWKLEDLIKSANEVQYDDGDGKWYPARPINYQFRSFREKLKEAWAVFTGKADCFIWPKGGKDGR